MRAVPSTAYLTLVTARDEEHASIVWVIGELDDFTVSRFEAECMRIALGSRLLIIELSTCSFLSSAGLRALVRLRRRLPTAIALVTGNAQFERLFHLAGLGHRPFTNLFDAMDAAASPGLWGTGFSRTDAETGWSHTTAAIGFRRPPRIESPGDEDRRPVGQRRIRRLDPADHREQFASASPESEARAEGGGAATAAALFSGHPPAA
jgi:anti-anti-sigma factor